jgi:excisionase family DNA binding protein
MLTVNEVAHRLQLKPDQVRAMIRRGGLPAVKIGSRWRVRSDALQALRQSSRPRYGPAGRRAYARAR